MRESVGYNYTLNIMIVFILFSFAILMAIVSYSKAFKINNRIMNEIEKCEGYNICTVDEINRILSSYGYAANALNRNCPNRDGVSAVDNPIGLGNYEMCIYYDENSENFNRRIRTENGNNDYYRYGIMTFMHIDLPFVERFRIPVYTRSNWILRLNAN